MDHASAYYHYALAHMYAEMAGEPGGREYIDQALENYKEALKADPDARRHQRRAGRILRAGRASRRRGKRRRSRLWRRNPKDLGALRLLARIYTSQIGGQNNRINQDMLKKAIEQYKKITGIAPEDVDCVGHAGPAGEGGAG